MLLSACLLAGCGTLPAAPGGGGEGAPPEYVNVVQLEEMRLQLVPIDAAGAPANDHPAAFEPAQLQSLLMSLRIESGEEGEVTLASPERLERLSEALSKALARASPQQDVSVVFFRNKAEGMFRGTSRYVTTARVFYRDDTLHLIFDELDDFFSEFRDTNIKPLEPGSRTRAADVGGARLTASETWQWHNDRRDWIELAATRDAIQAAAEAAPAVTAVGEGQAARSLEHGPAAGEREERSAAGPEPAQEADDTAPAAAEHGPAAEPAETPQPAGDAPSATPPDAVAAGSDGPEEDEWAEIEKRLEQLKRLRERGLITDKDYEEKKAELLEELP